MIIINGVWLPFYEHILNKMAIILKGTFQIPSFLSSLRIKLSKILSFYKKMPYL